MSNIHYLVYSASLAAKCIFITPLEKKNSQDYWPKVTFYLRFN